MKLLNVDTIEEAGEKLARYFSKIENETEKVPLWEAVGRYLGEEVRSDSNIPPFSRSIVDGYGVQARDTFGCSDSLPVFLDVVGQVEMGKPSQVSVDPGKAVYIPTGGMIPSGADAVVMVEYVETLDEKTIAVYKAAAPGDGMMKAGDDFQEGQILFEKGHRLRGQDVGMLAAIGMAEVSVFRRPSVTILSTGDEVVDVSQTPGPGQIRDINTYTLAALVQETGCLVRENRLIRDDEEALQMAAKEALEKSDLVLLSGGSSAGKKDMTAQIIDSLGSPGVITHGMAMKPGKPTIIGVVGEEACGEEFSAGKKPKALFGLPGHPMAAIISYKILVESFLKTYYFHSAVESVRIPANITENIHAGEGRETFTMVRLVKEGEVWLAKPIFAKSGSISQLRYSDGYVRLGHLSEGCKKGDLVEVILWRE